MDPKADFTDKSNKYFNYCRKLGSIQQISSIEPHGSDPMSEIANVNGWQVVIKKDEFKPGDIIVFIEIESELKKEKWAEDLKNSYYRVFTKKINGRISQGKLYSLDILKEYSITNYNVGDDLTSILDLYSTDVSSSYRRKFIEPKKPRGHRESLPTNLVDLTEVKEEPKIQSNLKFLELFNKRPYYAFLVYHGDYDIIFTTDPDDNNKYLVFRGNDIHNLKKEKGEWQGMDNEMKIFDKIKSLNYKYALQFLNFFDVASKTYKSYLLAIWSHDVKRFVDLNEFLEISTKIGLQTVNIVERKDSFNYNLNQLKELANSYEDPNNKQYIKGLVFRTQTDWNKDYRLSFQVISDNYLLDLS